MTNIWDVNWFLYLLGYIFLPRINLIFIWHFQGGNHWNSFWELYIPGWLFMPRMFTGLLVALKTQNYSVGVLLTICGFFIDGGTKWGWFSFRRRRRGR
ncbi:MAG TPA: hypothetical protein ENN07_06395 [candidate division Zixibacteria bacterium]|nr:hypothetical protein [candidate division Zixibacteria bacterium]